jgi:ParB/RepB/Spo0J family partition protein
MPLSSGPVILSEKTLPEVQKMERDTDKGGFDSAGYLSSGKERTSGPGVEAVVNIPISDIGPNPFQPRKIFDKNALNELSQSIREKGVLQPVTVRRVNDSSSPFRFELAAGERRLRASGEAGLTHIPAIVKDLSDNDMRDIGLIENIQRENLTTIDAMNGYADLFSIHGSADAVAQKTGKHKRTVEKYLKLHSEINSMPEMATIFAEQSARVEFATAEGFGKIASQVRRLQKSDRREYERIQRAMAKDIKKTVARLLAKYSQITATSKVKPESFRETEKEISLHLRISKDASLSAEVVTEARANAEAFLNRLSEIAGE